MRTYHFNKIPDHGAAFGDKWNMKGYSRESCTLEQFGSNFKDPAVKHLKTGDVVAIKCPQLRDHLKCEFCVTDYLGTIHQVYNGLKYQVVLCNSIGFIIYIDCDLEDLSIK